MIDWIKLRNEYINGNISYRKLAEKHNISFNTLKEKAVNEKWFEKKKEQHNKIANKSQQKTAEKIAEKEAQRLLRISNAADKLLEKIELATEQLDLYLEKQKTKTPVKVKDNKSGEVLNAFQENEKLKVAQLDRIDRAGLKQIASALKDLKDIQFTQNEEMQEDKQTITFVEDLEPDE